MAEKNSDNHHCETYYIGGGASLQIQESRSHLSFDQPITELQDTYYSWRTLNKK